MNMLTGQNAGMIIMLDIQHFCDQGLCMMIINQGNGAGHLPVIRPFLLDKLFPDHVAYRFGSVRILSLPDQTVETRQQFFFQRNTESYQFGVHRSYPEVIYFVDIYKNE